jgi:hydroxyethylthiazole kinase-like uncharacterized protein yjeF
MSLHLHTTPLDTARDARAKDRFTIDELGVDGIVLMEHAGRAVAEHALRMAKGGVIAIVCGPGNNGGDGWSAARHLLARACPLVVISTVAPTALTGDAGRAAEFFLRTVLALEMRAPSGAEIVRVISSVDDVNEVFARERPALIVDALFGTGLSRPLEAEMASLVRALAETRVSVLAVDLPSGLPTDGGAPAGAWLDADETITFAAKKIAHVCEPGHSACGQVTVVDIGVFRSPNATPSSVQELQGVSIAPVDGSEPRALSRTHKGAHGHVGIALGVPPTEGAALLAGHAAFRAGAGLVSLIGKSRVQAAPELMQRIGDDEAALTEGLSAFVMGPGFGIDEIAADRARALALAAHARHIPLVVDADALPHVLALGLSHPMVFTPHPGEAARLLGVDTREVQRDRIAAIRALASRFEGTLHVFILKGACPLVHAHGRPVVVVEGGTPALAVAGSGDILSGLIGALLARNDPPFEAACVGTFIHQQAGRALAARAARGHLAHEIADAFPPLFSILDTGPRLDRSHVDVLTQTTRTRVPRRVRAQKPRSDTM